jgi:hypothetical protein
MRRLALIVEGHGDVVAMPILVQRILNHRALSARVELIRRPHRMKRNQMVKADFLEKAIDLQATRVGPGGAILITLDADDDCPMTLARSLSRIAKRARADRDIGIVVANREYEAWFVAAARSLRGHRGVRSGVEHPGDPDAHPNPKAWMNRNMERGYSETLDQPALTACLDLGEAGRSRSFRKLTKEIERIGRLAGSN